MKATIGIVILIICIYFFGWWGLLSLIIILPIIGWSARHKGPFTTSKNYTKSINYKEANLFASRYPLSHKHLQNILLDISKEKSSHDEILTSLNKLHGYLRIEEYLDSEVAKSELLSSFVDEFSKIYPNWKKEYIITKEKIETF